MEVAAGPMFGLKDHVGLPVFLHGEKEKKVEELVLAAGRRSSGFCFVEQEEDVSSESSSIGAESSSSSEEDDRKDAGDEEVQSKLTEGPLGSLDSLEESLPIKRGLSNFFTGKSKSFASFSDVANSGAGELAKTENPFNKRRRILKACNKPSSWAARRASYISLLPRLTPLTVVEGDGDEDDDDDDAAAAGGESLLPPLPHHHHHGRDESNLKRAFRSPRSFSLSDLQHA